MSQALWLAILLGGAAAADVPPRTEPVAPELEVIDRFIPFGEARIEMTERYLEVHYGLSDVGVDMVPRVIVLHWTAGGTARGAWSAFAPERLPGRPELQAAGALNVSAHFIVDRDGTVWRLMPETRAGRHVIGMNHLAIGVENVGDGDRWPMTEAQVEANVALVRQLVSRHPTITHLIGHHEYRLMEGHPYFAERDPRYRTTKIDPGDKFMAAVRAQVSDLSLEAPPQP
jgi:N-acetyl-anhydromuramyl-L-alanine amidase AmpD